MTNTNKELEEMVEQMADIEHKRWSSWQKWMHECSTKNADGSLTIPADKVERWERQITTEYKDLSEEEKESDRKQVYPYLDIITSYREQGVKAALEGHGIESGEDFNQATARFEAVTEAIIKKGTVWLSESGNVITDEEYHDWRDFVDSVAKPEGSVIEKYIKINLKALTTQEDQLIVKE